jgi:CCR4-NOT complex subunit CAF16
MSVITVKNLDFDYGGPAILHQVNLDLPKGSRCLLVGANGAGKSTLLKLLAGKRLVRGEIYVLGKRSFFESPPVRFFLFIIIGSDLSWY